MAKFTDRLKHAYSVFTDPESRDIEPRFVGFGGGVTVQPGRTGARSYGSNERSIVTSMYARMSIDVASADIRHIRKDGNGRYSETMNTGLNNCLALEANIDQAARQFKQSIAWTMFEKGIIALVPTQTSFNPKITGSYDIETMRVGEILEWFPRHVRVAVYNDVTGEIVELRLPKTMVAIIENPLFEVMNQPNSTLQRLIRKLAILDAVDEASSSGKLDLIIQLPYVVKSDARRKQAEQRRNDIEVQLKNSKYGIAYTDGTEKITQLNRPTENNLLTQIEYLMEMLFSQLGVTKGIFDGTASEAEMLNYHNRSIEPILGAISQAIERRFITKTARTQGQTIGYFRDPFKYTPISGLGDVFDKLSRNEIATANELRAVMGWMPHSDAKADTLVNSNMPVDKRGGQQISSDSYAEVAPFDSST